MEGEGHGGDGCIAGAVKNVGGLLFAGLGRLTSAPHRRKAIELINKAHASGAGLVRACGEIGICLRTHKRWRKAFVRDGDGVDRRKGSPRLVSHRLSKEERQWILLACNQAQYASLPPGQIVPALADQGLCNSYGEAGGYGSQSSFFWMLHLEGAVPTARSSTATTGTQSCAKAQGRRSESGVELGHHLSAHHQHRAWDLAVPLSGDRRLEPQDRGLGCRRA